MRYVITYINITKGKRYRYVIVILNIALDLSLSKLSQVMREKSLTKMRNI